MAFIKERSSPAALVLWAGNVLVKMRDGSGFLLFNFARFYHVYSGL